MEYKVTIRVDNSGQKGNDFRKIGTVTGEDISAYRRHLLSNALTPHDERKKWERHENTSEICRLEAFIYKSENEKKEMSRNMRMLEIEQSQSKAQLAAAESEYQSACREVEREERELDACAKTIAFQVGESRLIFQEAQSIRAALNEIKEDIRDNVLVLSKTAPSLIDEIEAIVEGTVGRITGKKNSGMAVGINLNTIKPSDIDEKIMLEEARMYQFAMDMTTGIIECVVENLLMDYLKGKRLPTEWLEKLHAGVNQPENVLGEPTELIGSAVYHLGKLENDLIQSARKMNSSIPAYSKTLQQIKTLVDAITTAYERQESVGGAIPTIEDIELCKGEYAVYSIAFDCFKRTHALLNRGANSQRSYFGALGRYGINANEFVKAKEKREALYRKVNEIQAKDHTAEIAKLRLAINEKEDALRQANAAKSRLEAARDEKRRADELRAGRRSASVREPLLIPPVTKEMVDALLCHPEAAEKQIAGAVAKGEKYFAESLKKNPQISDDFHAALAKLGQIYAKNNGKLEMQDIASAFGRSSVKPLRRIGELRFAKIQMGENPDFRLILEISNPHAPVLCFLGKRKEGINLVDSYDAAIGKQMYWLFPGLLEPPRKATNGTVLHEENEPASQAPTPEQGEQKQETNGKKAPAFILPEDPVLKRAQGIVEARKNELRRNKLREQLRSATNPDAINAELRKLSPIKMNVEAEWHNALADATQAEQLADIAQLLAAEKQSDWLKQLAEVPMKNPHLCYELCRIPE
ncbi:MAG: hypothetical protein QW568_05490, partial [Candidatus Anstonellaceae archaeon]